MYSKAINNQKGVALILIAVAIVVLFGFGALAIDVGHLYNVKNQLQAAADAAALAGASEMSGSTFALMADSAYDAADRIALRNVADVAAVDTPLAPTGKPIPVKLNENAGNAANGDVVLGIWDGSSFAVSSDPELVNAVKVVARRAGANPEQPRVNNWFAKVFSLLPLGPTFDLSSIKAEAIAAKDQGLSLLPIAVNEYWLSERDTNKRPYTADIGGGKTVHDYPSSFVRVKEVAAFGNNQTVDSPAFGYTFAVFGSAAESNQVAQDPNGFVDLDLRSKFYFGAEVLTTDANGVPLTFGPQSFFEAQSSSGGCLNCNTYLPSTSKTQGTSSDKDIGDGYLLNGYPDDRLPPTAVYEYLRPGSGNYVEVPIPNVYKSADNDPSDCPYATLFYFDTSGGDPVASIKLYDKYKAGDKFMALVYDGTHTGTGAQNGPHDKLVTIVGYTIIEVDGYSSGNPKSIGLTAGGTSAAWAANKTALGPKGSTMYGHAVIDIIQPTTDHNGGCDFHKTLQDVREQFSTNRVRLVGTFPDAKYGMAPGQ